MNDELIRRDADMKCVDFGPARSFRLAFFGTPKIRKNFESRTPTLELHLPIQHYGRGHHDQMWTPDALKCEGK